MHATADRLDFAPPHPPGLLRGMALAILAHGLLLAALTWGITWNRTQDQTLSVSAELWSAVPQAAAPPLVETPPPPPPPPLVPEKVRPEPPPVKDAAIAQERQKRVQREKDKLAEDKRQREKEKREKAKQDKREDLKKREQQKKLADEKKRKEQEARRLEAEQEARELDKQRKDNLARMTRGLAGASGADNATGAGPRSAGPSATYGSRIVARIKPNIVFTDSITGNPKAEVEVKVSPDGTIVSRRLLKSSGVPAWDEAVLKAIDKTETLPRDTDGRVQPVLNIDFRPKD